MNHQQTYRVIVTRDDDHWLADVPELQGAHTFARTLMALDKDVREVIVLAADLPDDAVSSLKLAWEYHTGDAILDAKTARVRALRAKLEQIAAEAGASTAAMALELVDGGMSVRDTAVLLGISPQRVSQMTGHARAS